MPLRKREIRHFSGLSVVNLPTFLDVLGLIYEVGEEPGCLGVFSVDYISPKLFAKLAVLALYGYQESLRDFDSEQDSIPSRLRLSNMRYLIHKLGHDNFKNNPYVHAFYGESLDKLLQ